MKHHIKFHLYLGFIHLKKPIGWKHFYSIYLYFTINDPNFISFPCPMHIRIENGFVVFFYILLSHFSDDSCFAVHLFSFIFHIHKRKKSKKMYDPWTIVSFHVSCANKWTLNIPDILNFVWWNILGETMSHVWHQQSAKWESLEQNWTKHSMTERGMKILNFDESYFLLLSKKS